MTTQPLHRRFRGTALSGPNRHRSLRNETDFISLKGTIVNCAGGYAYGYRGWITGEEVVSTFQKKHGYNFFVPVDRGPDDDKGGEPIVPMGRFAHEAVATDQRTGIVYQTDDPGSGVGAGFYRYIPGDPEDLFKGGQLQMLGIGGRPQADLREGQTPGEPLPVEWFDIEDVDPTVANNAAATSVYAQGFGEGAAKFNRRPDPLAGLPRPARSINMRRVPARRTRRTPLRACRYGA